MRNDITIALAVLLMTSVVAQSQVQPPKPDLALDKPRVLTPGSYTIRYLFRRGLVAFYGLKETADKVAHLLTRSRL